MFAARCVGISLAVFLLVYVPLSIVTSKIWVVATRALESRSARVRGDFLFLLRILPFAIASIFTGVFTVPSFLLLEPRGTDEAVGTAPIVLGLCCFALLSAGVARTVLAQLKTGRALSKWLAGSELLAGDSSVPVFRTRNESPSLTVAGVYDPKVLISEAACAALTPGELRTALRHEVAHVRRYDNLKKLLLRLSAFPGMRALEQAWSEAAEMAADDAAVCSEREALDLASALIKVSRLNSVQAPAVIATGLLHSSTALEMRIKRLFSWHENSYSPRGWWYVLPPLAATILMTATTYSSMISHLHAATEWLVR